MSIHTSNNKRPWFRILLWAAFAFAGWHLAFTSIAQTQTLDEEIEALKKLPPEKVLQLAEKGQPSAMYLFAHLELKAATKDLRSSFRWTSLSTHDGENLPESEKKEAETRWAKSPETEIMAAGKDGNRGAAWVMGKIGSEQARARALQAFEWMKKAANAPLAPAQFDVALLYLSIVDGLFVPFNAQEGLRYLQMAADGNLEKAQHKIADLCLEGKTVPRDLSRGIIYLQKAVDQKCSRAQYELALQYANGNGEPRHPGESVIALLQKSAAQTNQFAMVELGHRYRLGLGLENDIRKARDLYERANLIDQTMSFENQTGIGAFLEIWKEE